MKKKTSGTRGQSRTPQLKPLGLITHFQSQVERRAGTPLNLLCAGSKGKNMRGAKLILEACEGNGQLAMKVVDWIVGNDQFCLFRSPNMMYIAGRTGEVLHILAEEDMPILTDHSAYARTDEAAPIDIESMPI